VREFVTHSLNAGLDPVVGGHIPIPDYAISGGGYLADDTVDRIMALAAELGATHFVLPANEPENIQRRSEWLLTHVIDPVLYVTGIGPLGGSITESFQAAQGIATRRAIIGRRICAASDPHAATQTLANEMNRFA
jgi:orotidine-5'-phosphate decarboxylase